MAARRCRAFVRRSVRGLALASLCVFAFGPSAGELTGQSVFPETLLGAWLGRAEQTPHGPLPYDLEFVRAPDGSVRATAEPGGALHHWWFSVSEGLPALRFLTTFRGNAEPVHLFASAAPAHGPEMLRFEPAGPSPLAVELRVDACRLNLDVSLRGQPHVLIRLHRRTRMAAPGPAPAPGSASDPEPHCAGDFDD